MTLTITSWWWVIPTILTIAVWIWAIFFHYKSQNTGFNVDGLAECLVAIITTLVSWLIYFIIF